MAVLVLISLVPAVLFWLVIHPFIVFWRRAGRFTATSFGAGLMIASMVPIYLYRDLLLGRDLGTQVWLWLPAVMLLVFSMAIERARKKHLNLNILTGGPEFANDGAPETLLNKGIYARMRHPRYVAFALALPGWALFSNHSGLYLYVLISWALLYLIVIIEEGELRRRFGPAYEDYSRDVPRLPKLF